MSDARTPSESGEDGGELVGELKENRDGVGRVDVRSGLGMATAHAKCHSLTWEGVRTALRGWRSRCEQQNIGRAILKVRIVAKDRKVKSDAPL